MNSSLRCIFCPENFSQVSFLDKHSPQSTCCFLTKEIKVNNTTDLGCFSLRIVWYKEAICHSGGAGRGTMKCSRDSGAGMSKSNGRPAQERKRNRRRTFPVGCVVIDLWTIRLIFFLALKDKELCQSFVLKSLLTLPKLCIFYLEIDFIRQCKQNENVDTTADISHSRLKF